MIALALDKIPLMGVGLPMKGSTRQELELSTPKQDVNPGDHTPLGRAVQGLR
jgi:hypothetical protein